MISPSTTQPANHLPLIQANHATDFSRVHFKPRVVKLIFAYRVDFSERDEHEVTITVRNFRDAPQRHRVKLKLPSGLTADPPVLSGTVDAENRQSYKVRLKIDRTAVSNGLQMIPFDITLDGKHYGELFDSDKQSQSE